MVLFMLKPLEPMEEMVLLRLLCFRVCGAYVNRFCMSGLLEIKRINLLIFDLFISGPMEEIRMVVFFFKLLQHFFKIST